MAVFGGLGVNMTGMKTIRERFEDYVSPEPNSGCWLWTGWMSCGRPMFHMTNYGPGIGAHRAAWRIYHGDHGRCVVVRRCDNRACVNPAHLYLGSRLDVQNHNGMILFGEKNAFSKLKNADVKMIRESKLTGPELAWALGVSTKTIYRIRRGESWRETSQ